MEIRRAAVQRLGMVRRHKVMVCVAL